MDAHCNTSAHAAIPSRGDTEEKRSSLVYQAATIGVILLFLISFW